MAWSSNRSRRMADAAEGLWIALQAVNDGDWSKQSEVWRAMAEHARDYYFALLQERMAEAVMASERV